MSQALFALLTAPTARLAGLGVSRNAANRRGCRPLGWDNRPTWDNWSRR